MVKRPSDYQLRAAVIGDWDVTWRIKQRAFRHLSEDNAIRLESYWYKIGHWFLRYLSCILDIVHIATYSTAIFLAVSGKPLIAAGVGSLGIALSKRLSRHQVSIRARKVAFDSIQDRERQRRDERRRNPLV